VTEADVRRVLVIIGTRPEAIKLGPVVHELKTRRGIDPVVVVTGQHREMVDPVLDVFDIVPEADLALLTQRQRLADITVRALAGLDQVLEDDPPDALVVQGDTTTAFAGALAALYHRVPVVHVEAGLRTGSWLSPYPEEANRKLIGQLAALHLAPTPRAASNLRREGIADEHIVITGNTIIDALRWAIERAPAPVDPQLVALESDPRPLVLFTVHRREAWDEGLANAAKALATIARESDVLIVVPLHPNPVVRDAVLPALEGLDNVVVTEPLGYLPFCRLLRRARLVLTDSGGIQEEAPSLGVPVLVLRDVTERPEAVQAGAARLVGTDAHEIATEALRLLRDDDAHRSMASVRNPYGDGRAAVRSVDALQWFFGQSDRPDDFNPDAR
jgi:UDP-N-acetylglucosamine 2-epimerase (non-hydrolysing)